MNGLITSPESTHSTSRARGNIQGILRFSTFETNTVLAVGRNTNQPSVGNHTFHVSQNEWLHMFSASFTVWLAYDVPTNHILIFRPAYYLLSSSPLFPWSSRNLTRTCSGCLTKFCHPCPAQEKWVLVQAPQLGNLPSTPLAFLCQSFAVASTAGRRTS